MTTLDRNCRFCQRKLVSIKVHGPPESPTSLHIYGCESCNSEESFDGAGRVVDYSFVVEGQYLLDFWPPRNFFEIMRLVDCAPVLELNWLPVNLTPQNTTVNKIKTMIVFS